MMIARFIFLRFFFSLFFLPPVYSQQDSSTASTDKSVFIKGHKGEKYISTELFNSGFEWQTTDSSFTVARARLCWDFSDGLICLAIKGNRVSFDTIKTKEWYHTPHPQSLVTLDEIRLQKDGKLYKAPSFVFNLAPSADIPGIYDTLAKTEAFIPSFQHDFLLPRSLFKKGFTLSLEDSSYTVLSFFVSFDYADKEEPVSFYFEGNRLHPALPGYQQALDRLMYKDGITIENIYARKNGKVYRVPDLMFALRK